VGAPSAVDHVEPGPDQREPVGHRPIRPAALYLTQGPRSIARPIVRFAARRFAVSRNCGGSESSLANHRQGAVLIGSGYSAPSRCGARPCRPCLISCGPCANGSRWARHAEVSRRLAETRSRCGRSSGSSARVRPQQYDINTRTGWYSSAVTAARPTLRHASSKAAVSRRGMGRPHTTIPAHSGCRCRGRNRGGRARR